MLYFLYPLTVFLHLSSLLVINVWDCVFCLVLDIFQMSLSDHVQFSFLGYFDLLPYHYNSKAIRGAFVIGFFCPSVCRLSVTNVFIYPTVAVHCLNNHRILTFKVSKWLYWSAWYDRIFENGPNTSLVARNGNKRLFHISVILRDTWLKFRILVTYPKLYYWNLYQCYGSYFGFFVI